jgi:hypothetical protein
MKYRFPQNNAETMSPTNTAVNISVDIHAKFGKSGRNIYGPSVLPLSRTRPPAKRNWPTTTGRQSPLDRSRMTQSGRD